MTDDKKAELERLRIKAMKLMQWAIKSEDGRLISRMVTLARSDPRLAIGHELLDADHWLLNCPNGTLDLRTGTLRAHCREDMITKLCPTRYDPSAKCPVWERALLAIFDKKPGLLDYSRRLCGYCLTGRVNECILPVCYGIGSNGKSLFFKTVSRVMGPDYAAPGARELLSSKEDTHPTFKADLCGRRLVTLAETREGGGINEALIKDLTGGEDIKGRFCNKDFFSFKPTHKFMLASNHKPEIRGGDDGIWRRLRLIPFTVRFWDADKEETGPAHLQADKTLDDKLQAEDEGILAWMVRGCMEWQAGGMREPAEVVIATREYRSEQDVVRRFIEELCILGGERKVFKAKLYAAFKEWWSSCGEDGKPMTKRKFNTDIMKHEGISETKNSTMVYDGIDLRGKETPSRGKEEHSTEEENPFRDPETGDERF